MRKSPSAYAWIVELLEGRPGFVKKIMFGCEACYLHDRLMLVVPLRRRRGWSGVLVPTDRTRHASLEKWLPALFPHPVLKKWLYLDDADESFEHDARELVELVLINDPRIGVVPGWRRRARSSQRGKA